MNLLGLLPIVICSLHLEAANVDFKSLYKPLSKRDLKKLQHLKVREDPALYSGQYEGDIIISPEQMEYYSRKKGTRNGKLNKKHRWLKKIVPIRIRKRAFKPDKAAKIRDAMKEIEKVSCITFVKYKPRIHKDFITIQGLKPGCFSSVGRQGGEQFINIGDSKGDSCFRTFTIVHEFLHALGFFHMHSSTNRDEYVKIVHDKIKKDFRNSFRSYGSNIITSFDVEYDYGSVMHYPGISFSIDGSPTIIPLKNLNGAKMGQREKISEGDKAKLNKMYCNGVSKSLKSLVDKNDNDVEDEMYGGAEEGDEEGDEDGDEDDTEEEDDTEGNEENLESGSSSGEEVIYRMFKKLLNDINSLFGHVKNSFKESE